MTRERETEIRSKLELYKFIGAEQDDMDDIDGLLTELDAVRADLKQARINRITVEQVDCPRCGYQQGLP